MPKDKREKYIKIIITISLILIVTPIIFMYDINKSFLYASISIGMILFIVVFILLIILMVRSLIKNEKEGPFLELTEEERKKYKDVSNEDIKSMFPEHDLNTFTDELVNKFIDIQNALSDLDYAALSGLCTDELYNTYKKELEVQKLKNEQIIKKDLKKNWARIVSLKVENNKIIARVRVNVSYDKFNIDNITKEIIKGDYNSNDSDTFDLVFVRSTLVDSEIDCPNCGAPYEDICFIQCEYCGSILIKDTRYFVLSNCIMD